MPFIEHPGDYGATTLIAEFETDAEFRMAIAHKAAEESMSLMRVLTREQRFGDGEHFDHLFTMTAERLNQLLRVVKAVAGEDMEQNTCELAETVVGDDFLISDADIPGYTPPPARADAAPSAEVAEGAATATYTATLSSPAGTTYVSATNEAEWRHEMALNASYAIEDLLDTGTDAKLSAKRALRVRALNSVVNSILSGDDCCPLDEMADTVYGATNWEKVDACDASLPLADPSPTPAFARAAPHLHAANHAVHAPGGLRA